MPSERRARRVLCLVPYPHAGASNRLRVEQYVERLAAIGLRLELSPFLDETAFRSAYLPGHVREKTFGVLRGAVRRVRDAMRAGSYDLVLVHREATPFGPLVVERAIAKQVPIVYDFDDAVFIRQVHPANERWSWLRDPRRVAALSRMATTVIVQNEYLAQHARAWNTKVLIVPTPVDTDRHHPRVARPDGPLVIGWLGSETTAPYLRLVDGVLATITREFDVKVKVVGGEYENRGIRDLEVLPFSLEREQLDLESFDIGILPEPDDAWSRGKGGYKALLYMAVGIPVVASGVGVNPDIVWQGETGFCARSEEEWLHALRTLLRNSALRQRLGVAGRARVVAEYSVAVQAPRFAAILEEAMASPEIEPEHAR